MILDSTDLLPENDTATTVYVAEPINSFDVSENRESMTDLDFVDSAIGRMGPPQPVEPWATTSTETKQYTFNDGGHGGPESPSSSDATTTRPTGKNSFKRTSQEGQSATANFFQPPLREDSFETYIQAPRADTDSFIHTASDNPLAHGIERKNSNEWHGFGKCFFFCAVFSIVPLFYTVMSYTYFLFLKQSSFHGCRPHELNTSCYPTLHFCLLLTSRKWLLPVWQFFDHLTIGEHPNYISYVKSYFSLCVHVLQAQTT